MSMVHAMQAGHIHLRGVLQGTNPLDHSGTRAPTRARQRQEISQNTQYLTKKKPPPTASKDKEDTRATTSYHKQHPPCVSTCGTFNKAQA